MQIKKDPALVEKLTRQDFSKREVYVTKGKIAPDPKRSLVEADFDTQNRLVLSFDDGKVLKTKPINQVINLEQYVSVAGGNSPEETAQQSESSGHVNRTDSVVSFNESLRTFYITPAALQYIIFVQGNEIVKTLTDSITIPNVTGNYFIYFDINGVLQYQSAFTEDLLSEKAYTAVVYWNATQQKAVYFGDERHGIIMDYATHFHFHQAFGTQYVSGLALTNIAVDASGDSNSSAIFGSEAGLIRDEDLAISIPAFEPIAQVPVLYRLGASGAWYRSSVNNYPLIHDGKDGWTGTLAYNKKIGSDWQLLNVPTNEFVLVHILATNDPRYPVVAILGSFYNTKDNARENAEKEFLAISGIPFQEFVAVGTIIYQTANSYLNEPKARIVSVDANNKYVDWRYLSSPAGSGSSSGTSFYMKNLTGLNPMTPATEHGLLTITGVIVKSPTGKIVDVVTAINANQDVQINSNISLDGFVLILS